VHEALWIWRQYPKQIASDLSRFHRRQVREWHDGEMSSYDLLVLLEFMDDEGALKSALRGGEYSERELTQRHHANETARLRATMHAVHGGQRYEPPTLMSKAEQLDQIEEAEAAAERREEVFTFADRSFPAFDTGEDE
jgi:hypothetical protein